MGRVFILLLAFFAFLYADKVIYVDLAKQKIIAQEDGEAKIKGAISSGKAGRETPTGTYTISQKKISHRSNLWPKPNGGAEMPYMMRLSSTPMALHLGNLPGYPASHGCVRIEKSVAKKIYYWAEIGTKVKIYGKTPKSKNFKKSFIDNYLDMDDKSITGKVISSPHQDEVQMYFGNIITKNKEERGYDYVDKVANY